MRNQKLTNNYQRSWENNQLFDKDILKNIGSKVQLHTEILNVRSSAAACINVLGNLDKDELKNFLNKFDLKIDEIIEFPSNSDVSGEKYDDQGYVIFEWIGPKRSPIYESGGKRGQHRTSIDGFVLAKIESRITQILIEWKFTENYTAKEQLQRFSGEAGIERLRRYSNSIAKLRKKKDLPFNFGYEGGFGLFDLGYEPFYQLLRMTLLAKLTTPLRIGPYEVNDYRILHLSHSENDKLNIIEISKIKYCPYLRGYVGKSLHETWADLLADFDKERFKYGLWNKELKIISNKYLRDYLTDRYE